MKAKKLRAVYFSPTGTTQAVVREVARSLAGELQIEYTETDFTLPSARQDPLVFEKEELVVFGTPVYAGRVPNVLLRYLSEMQGKGALAVPVVLFGNRAFDDALAELAKILHGAGCYILAAGAFVGEHSFSYTLAKGRPDTNDLLQAQKFAVSIAQKLETTDRSAEEPGIPGDPEKYYQPRSAHGKAIDIRKAKPVTGEACDECGICATICPMGSIPEENVRECTGICIKCGACIKKCPKHAKYFDDEGYLYHKTELEKKFQRRAEIQLFL